MPQYFYVQSTSSTRYFSCTASQESPDPGPDTSDTETGTWTTTQSTAEANSFNTGETGAREQIDVKLNFNALWTDDVNANTMKVEYQITLMGCDTRTGTYVSQGSTYTRTVTATEGVVTGDNPKARTSGGTAETATYNFMSKLKFWHLKVRMVNSAFVQVGATNSVKVYGFVAIHDDGIIRRKYKTKTLMHGSGLQVMSGPKSYVRFGRNQNLIFGNLNIEGDDDGGGGGYYQKNLTVGTNETFTTHPLYVVGDIAATGNVIAYVSSDERLKSNITPLEDSLEKVKRLNPVDFSWNDTTKGWGTETPADMGLLAQDVEKQFPSIVREMDDGYKGIRYDRLIPVLVDCIKTQDSKIEELKELVEKMTDKLEEE